MFTKDLVPALTAIKFRFKEPPHGYAPKNEEMIPIAENVICS